MTSFGVDIGGIRLHLRSDRFDFNGLTRILEPFASTDTNSDVVVEVLPLVIGSPSGEGKTLATGAWWLAIERYYRRLYAHLPSPAPDVEWLIERQKDNLSQYLIPHDSTAPPEPEALVYVGNAHLGNDRASALLVSHDDAGRFTLLVGVANGRRTATTILVQALAHACARASADTERLLIHASSVARDNRGYLFAGFSGRGKTTVARMSQDYTVLADDISLIARHDDQFGVCSTPWGALFAPWDGRLGPVARNVPLRAIFFLEHGPEVCITPVLPGGAAARLLRHVLPWPEWEHHISPGTIARTLDLCSELCSTIACYEMRFSLSSDIWGAISALA